MFTPEEVAGITAAPIDDTLTLPEVLDRLLAGTRLTATYANGAVIIRGRSAPAELAAGEIASADIIVTGTHIRHSQPRSEEHTSELQSLMRISYAVFCLKKKKTQANNNQYHQHDTTHDQQTNTDSTAKNKPRVI